LNEKAGNTAIVFCSTCASSVKIALMLRQLSFGAIALHGQMSQVFSFENFYFFFEKFFIF